MSTSDSGRDVTTLRYIAAQTFKMSVSGLKPLTKHEAYIVDIKCTSVCAPISSTTTNQNIVHAIGQPLISDASGKLEFVFFFSPNNYKNGTIGYGVGAGSGFGRPLGLWMSRGSKVFKISSLDGSSKATTAITVTQTGGTGEINPDYAIADTFAL